MSCWWVCFYLHILSPSLLHKWKLSLSRSFPWVSLQESQGRKCSIDHEHLSVGPWKKWGARETHQNEITAQLWAFIYQINARFDAPTGSQMQQDLSKGRWGRWLFPAWALSAPLLLFWTFLPWFNLIKLITLWQKEKKMKTAPRLQPLHFYS